MQVDYFLGAGALAGIGDEARQVEARAYDCVWLSESANDALLSSFAALAATRRLRVGTSVAIALARSPMVTAYSAWELAGASEGRFVLGLGAGAAKQIIGRFGMPADAPTARMEEYVRALRAIWGSWVTGDPLAFEGRFYRHTEMEAMYRPAAHGHEVPVFLAAVGPRMAAVAGRVADGVLLHPLTTVAALDGSIVPALEAGLVASGRGRADLELVLPLLVVVTDQPDAEAQRSAVRKRIAWYAVREQYAPLLDAAGCGDLGDELRALRADGDWARREAVIDDDLLDTFAVVAEGSAVATAVRARFGDRIDRVCWFFDRFAGDEPLERSTAAALAG